MTARPERTVDGCLLEGTLEGTITYPQKAVLLCGTCPARSDHVGQLPCRHIGPPKPSQK